MEETLSVIIHGCKLARDLESSLANLSSSPNVLSNSCNEIVRVFESAIHQLSSLMVLINSSASHSQASSLYPPHHQILAGYGGDMSEPGPTTTTTTLDHHHPADPGVQEWLKSSYVQAIELVQAQLLVDQKNPLLMSSASTGMDLMCTSTASGVHIHVDHNHGQLDVKNMAEDNIAEDDGEGGTNIRMKRSSTGGGEFQREEGSDSGKSPAVVQRSRKRKDGANKRTLKVAGPRIGGGGGGNSSTYMTDIPPDDGFTWRKYGQKEILGSTFPRGYYRCTHRNFYGCQAKKQVQRLDNDPNTFEVTYYGHHTCHISSSSSAAYNTGGSNGGGGSGGAGSLSPMYVMGADISSTTMTTSSSSVVELVDAIFNSGMSSSSNNSLDSIFPSFPPPHHHNHHQQDK